MSMILESYFDDSSDPRRNRFYACGGLLGGPEQWDAFEILWSQETHKLAEPFRSTNCETGHGQFEDWPKTQRDELMARLVSVLKTVQLRGFASIVPIKEYKAAFPGCGEHDAFLLALRQAVMNMAFIAHGLNHDVSVWFEKGTIDSTVRKVFDSIAGWKEWSPAKRLRTPRFETKQLKALQSADLIAREAFKHVDNLGDRPTRKPIVRLEGRLYFVLWNYKALEYLAANGGPSNLDLLSKWDKIEDAPRLGPIAV
jgi:hypothetical protein